MLVLHARLLALCPNFTLHGHPKGVHSDLIVYRMVNGGRVVFHSKGAILLVRLLALSPDFTLGGHPKAFIMENYKQRTCTSQVASARHMFRSHERNRYHHLFLNSHEPCPLLSFPNLNVQPVGVEGLSSVCVCILTW